MWFLIRTMLAKVYVKRSQSFAASAKTSSRRLANQEFQRLMHRWKDRVNAGKIQSQGYHKGPKHAAALRSRRRHTCSFQHLAEARDPRLQRAAALTRCKVGSNRFPAGGRPVQPSHLDQRRRQIKHGRAVG